MSNETYPEITHESEVNPLDQLGNSIEIIFVDEKRIYPDPEMGSWYYFPLTARDKESNITLNGQLFSVEKNTRTSYTRIVLRNEDSTSISLRKIVVFQGNGIFHHHEPDGSTRWEKISPGTKIVYEAGQLVAFTAGEEDLIGISIGGPGEQQVVPSPSTFETLNKSDATIFDRKFSNK